MDRRDILESESKCKNLEDVPFLLLPTQCVNNGIKLPKQTSILHIVVGPRKLVGTAQCSTPEKLQPNHTCYTLEIHSQESVSGPT